MHDIRLLSNGCIDNLNHLPRLHPVSCQTDRSIESVLGNQSIRDEFVNLFDMKLDGDEVNDLNNHHSP
jgi:hypothetical protein